jgi:hypothetical protein
VTRSERHRYYASREWALLKERVRERSGGNCERCGDRPYEQTHHLTYERLGNELLEDLQGLCAQCHEYVSGKTSEDPFSITRSTKVRIEDGVLLCPNCGEGCLHHVAVDAFTRSVEDGDSDRISASREPAVAACMPADNPSRRRDGVRVAFSCEFCESKFMQSGGIDTAMPRRIFALHIIQHKGNTFMEWSERALLVPHVDYGADHG